MQAFQKKIYMNENIPNPINNLEMLIKDTMRWHLCLPDEQKLKCLTKMIIARMWQTKHFLSY